MMANSKTSSSDVVIASKDGFTTTVFDEDESNEVSFRPGRRRCSRDL